jgi:hypothetical protein
MALRATDQLRTGDNDPIDVLELGGRTMRVGDVVEVGAAPSAEKTCRPLMSAGAGQAVGGAGPRG